jgi:uncharacterized membrane-anchored protein
LFNRKKEEENNEEVMSLETTKQQNKELHQQLTNKNQDYMFQLDNRLNELGYHSVKKAYVFNNMYQEIITAQKSSIPAKRIYGTVTEQADNILGKNVDIPEEEQEKSPTWMLYMDGALLMGGLFGIVNGISAWRSADTQVGLFQVLINFLVGGLAVLVLTKYAPKPGQSKGLLKYILATIAVMFFWVLIITFAFAIIPDVLNPPLPGPWIIGIAVVALIARWYLKRKLDIQGTLF